MENDQQTYNEIQTPTLFSLLNDPDKEPEIHEKALGALSLRGTDHRTPGLGSTLMKMVQFHQQYSTTVMSKTVEVLALDGSTVATAALLGALPYVLDTVLSGKQAVDQRFREMYYRVLLTRQRDQDLDAWGDLLPKLTGRQLAGALVDPVGEPLAAIEPRTLIERLQVAERTRALMLVVSAVIQGMGSVNDVKWAVPLLRESSDPAELENGLNSLEQLWTQAKKAGREKLVANIETILRALDNRPRTGVEKLSGKRPWAD